MIMLAIQLTQEQRCWLLICGQHAKLTLRLKVELFPDEESLPFYMSPILVLHTPALAAQVIRPTMNAVLSGSCLAPFVHFFALSIAIFSLKTGEYKHLFLLLFSFSFFLP